MLRGARVLLRPYERDDVKRQHDLMGNLDLVISGYGAWSPTPLATKEKEFDERVSEVGQWRFAIEADGAFIGFVMLHPWSIDQRGRSASFAIAILHPDYVGKGYGREALTLFLDWAFRIQNFRRIALIAWADNERAIRLYKRLGFVEEGRSREAEYINGRYVDVVSMGLLRREWEASQQAAQEK